MSIQKRENLASRLGFLLLSAGCAIGLGNVWRFPFITGKYGGAVFLIFYLIFLLIMGLPVLIMEFAVGRGSGLSMGDALKKLEPAGTKWHGLGWMTIVGCYALMMFYIPVAGWMVNYMYKGISGTLMAPPAESTVAAVVEVTEAQPVPVSDAVEAVSNAAPTAIAAAEATEAQPVPVSDAVEAVSNAAPTAATVVVEAEAQPASDLESAVAETEEGKDAEKKRISDYVGGLFDGTLSDPVNMIIWTIIVSAIGFGVCALGVQKGVERITKFMMAGLLVIMIGLAIYALTLKGSVDGLKFYLKPDWHRAMEGGIWSLINDAMNQAFFTLSIGIGSMCIFGSYLKKERSLTTESAIIVGLDTFVALTAGLIIFPACFAFGVNPDAGPGLIFVTLPNVFNSMPTGVGRAFGALFFVFMSAAALTTVIAVVENCIAYFMDGKGWSRGKSTLFNFVLLTLLTLPCILGFNVWGKFNVPHIGGVLDCEDFIVSNTLLPLGSLVFCLFCCHRYGWGWKNFTAEADTGTGAKFPQWARFYLTWILPVVLVAIFVIGYWQKFAK